MAQRPTAWRDLEAEREKWKEREREKSVERKGWRKPLSVYKLGEVGGWRLDSQGWREDGVLKRDHRRQTERQRQGERDSGK